jgi:hypothetical protein
MRRGLRLAAGLCKYPVLECVLWAWAGGMEGGQEGGQEGGEERDA